MADRPVIHEEVDESNSDSGSQTNDESDSNLIGWNFKKRKCQMPKSLFETKIITNQLANI